MSVFFTNFDLRSWDEEWTQLVVKDPWRTTWGFPGTDRTGRSSQRPHVWAQSCRCCTDILKFASWYTGYVLMDKICSNTKWAKSEQLCTVTIFCFRSEVGFASALCACTHTHTVLNSIWQLSGIHTFTSAGEDTLNVVICQSPTQPVTRLRTEGTQSCCTPALRL